MNSIIDLFKENSLIITDTNLLHLIETNEIYSYSTCDGNTFYTLTTFNLDELDLIFIGDAITGAMRPAKDVYIARKYITSVFKCNPKERR